MKTFILSLFTMEGCGPCKQVKAELESLNRSDVVAVELDVRDHSDSPLLERYNITSVPALFLLDAETGECYAYRVGAGDPGSTVKWIEEEIAVANTHP